jgi:hypothetical protein
MKRAVLPWQILSFILLTVVFSCTKEFSFENHAAKGTLKDLSGFCFPQILQGTFYNGITPDSDTAYVTITVNVTKVGSYSILTDTQNGFGFVNSGTFTSLGINTIHLKPTGTPVNPVPTNFTIRFDTSFCSLTINVSDSSVLHQNIPPVTQPANNWRFTDEKRGVTYKGLFENNYTLNFGLLTVLVLSTKDAQAPGDSTFTMNIAFPGTITPGSYSTDDTPTGIVFRTFSDPCGNCAGGGLIPISIGATVIINVTDYDPSTRVIKGNFSGTTMDWVNELAAIKNGVFTAVVK